MNTILKMHINELDESLVPILRELFKGREIIIEIKDSTENIKASQDLGPAVKKIQTKNLSDFLGSIDWKLDGMELQKKLREEW
ncbi:MAG: hypothetical protein KDK36_18720 [Leptospiraceae bacterium]|nr:hypothetical protein [Leptospiraceae bacterium]